MSDILEIAGQTVDLTPKNLYFDETTLSSYMQKEGGYYDSFGSYLALAEKVQQLREMEYETIYNERLVEAKEKGATDKISEAKAKADPDVLAARTMVIESKYKVKRLVQHLKAWDKNHDNAQSMGYMLRKEMDKLNFEIKGSGGEYLRGMIADKMINDIKSIDEQMESGSDGFDDLDIDGLKSMTGR